jgi:hypothetical protein
LVFNRTVVKVIGVFCAFSFLEMKVTRFDLPSPRWTS